MYRKLPISATTITSFVYRFGLKDEFSAFAFLQSVTFCFNNKFALIAAHHIFPSTIFHYFFFLIWERWILMPYHSVWFFVCVCVTNDCSFIATFCLMFDNYQWWRRLVLYIVYITICYDVLTWLKSEILKLFFHCFDFALFPLNSCLQLFFIN